MELQLQTIPYVLQKWNQSEPEEKTLQEIGRLQLEIETEQVRLKFGTENSVPTRRDGNLCAPFCLKF